jgi:hypothetical protein
MEWAVASTAYVLNYTYQQALELYCREMAMAKQGSHIIIKELEF